MLLDPRGYRIVEPIHESSRTLVFRAVREHDQRPVVLKILKREAATPGTVDTYHHEHQVLMGLRTPGVIEIHGIETAQGLPLLVLEDFGAESLARLHRKQRFSLERLLSLAVRIVDTLADLHDHGIIHGDINPANILLDPVEDVVKLADFGSSQTLSGEHLAAESQQRLEGTLAYISPEQTGRMNRPVDHRTDFYSLGVSLYELCTGRLPFAGDDPVQLVHSHLARQPTPAHQIEPEVPEAVSDIVLRLMAKMPEERYQTGRGCAHDLRECQRQLHESGFIHRFTLGQDDHIEWFRLAPRLYGREREIAAMTAAFERAAGGARHLVLVLGAPGIGKSVLVRELVAPIAHGRGYFVQGKFDQYRRSVPYSAVAQAFGGLVSQILAEPDERVARWRAELHTALGPSAQALVEVIPDLAHLLGPQPPAPRLGPTETEHRFTHALQCFLGVACRGEHPLVAFLDDLQWADAASLRLVKLMMTDPDMKHLLIVGAYRDGEVDATHPLAVTLDQIRYKLDVQCIALLPLAIEHVSRLLADTLYRSLADCAELAALVVAKTAGNPFFVNQFLRALHQDRFLVFDRSLRGWRWDLAAIQALGITDNVVELMVERMRKLPAPTQRMIELCACMGNVFDTGTLSVICEDGQAAVQARLAPAIEMGLLQPLGPSAVRPDGGSGVPAVSISFAHDRVQQAAYGLTGTDKPATHLRIARLLARALTPAAREQRLFELAEHFSLGADLLHESAERLTVAALCLAAGRRARDTMSYDTARRFLRTGLALMPTDGWRASYELMRDLALATVEVEYRNAGLDAARRLSDEILANARDLLDKIAVYDFQIQFHISQNQLGTAVEIMLAVLAMLGFEVPQDPAARDAREQELRARLALDEAGFEALERLPALTDRHQEAIIRTLIRASAPASHHDPALWRLLIAMTVEQCMCHGHSSLAAVAYGYYAGVVGGLYQDLERSYRYGKLGMRLIERFPDPQFEIKARNPFCVFVIPWSQPLGDAVEPLAAYVQRGLEVGDLEFGMLCAAQYLIYQIVLGVPLEGLHREALAYIALIERHHMSFHCDFVRISERVIRALIGLPAPKNDPGPPVYNPFYLMLFEWQAQAMLRYIMGDHEAALAITERAAQGEMIMAFLLVAEQAFCRSLAILAALPDDPERARALLAEVERNQARFAVWAARAPMNFRHQHTLIEAERARVRGDVDTAIAAYDEAIDGAHELGRLRDEALACERAASFHASRGRRRLARMYLAEACDTYRRWGAHAKVSRLETEHAWLVQRRVAGRPTMTTGTASSSGGGHALDLESVLRASQALSSQLVLDALLAELMKIIIENAGAQRGHLLLARTGSLTIEAHGDADSGSYRALPSLALSTHAGAISLTAVNYVARTGKRLVLRDAGEQEPYAQDPYVRAHRPRSLLCAPIGRHGELIGIVYLENNLAVDAFTPGRVEVVQMLATQAAISIENARLLRNLELSKDVAERTRAEAERARAEAELASRAKSAFLASVNHELRTPMNGIIGMIELLLGTRLDDEQQDYLTTARTAAEQLLRIIRDTLDLSRIEAGKLDLEPIRFSLDDCLVTLVRILTLRIQAEGLTFALDVAGDVPRHIFGDRDRLLQVLLNLLGNAVKFTPAGGSVWLRVRVSSRAAEQALLRFEVHDTGIGIAAEEQKIIFEPFTQVPATEARKMGSGLGLAIVSKLVMLMQGTLSLESEPGRGSCFSFTARFGLWQPELAPEPSASIVRAPAAISASLRILVAEDNQINQMVATQLLRLDGHTCTVAANGAEALRMLESETFDAVLMDVQMPVMDGLATTREIRRREQGTGQHVCIIAVTASATTEVVAECTASGMDRYLSKPLRIDALRDVLRVAKDVARGQQRQ